MARLVLALLFGGAALVLAMRGAPIPATLAHVLVTVARDGR